MSRQPPRAKRTDTSIPYPTRVRSGGAGANQQAERADPVPRRPAGRRQDLARPQHRESDGPRIRAPVAGRRARRGGNSRPPPHLYRFATGQDRHQSEKGGRDEDRKSVVEGQSVSGRVYLGGRRTIKKKKKYKNNVS